MQRYISTSWGYIQRATSLADKNFILFVGGADNRRKLADLVATFNQLKARGSDLCLVLSGDTMRGPNAIPSPDVQNALGSSPFLDDIYFMGFTDDATRNWLYKHAKAFVFPSTYEGFGLPVLEAMEFETPVICYDNLAVREVGGALPLYATDVLTLTQAVERVLSMSKDDLQSLKKRGRQHSRTFSWKATATAILAAVKS
jgi:glycosyltransferase involved in cell wall biosynthesis